MYIKALSYFEKIKSDNIRLECFSIFKINKK